MFKKKRKIGEERKCFLTAFTQQFRIGLQSVFHLGLLFTTMRAKKLYLHSCSGKGVGDEPTWAPSTPPPPHHCCSRGSPAEFDCCCREKKQRPGGRTGWRPTLVKSSKRSKTTQMATFWTASEYIGEGILLQRGSAYSYVPTSLVSNLRETAAHRDRCTLGENDLPLRFPLPYPGLGYSAARNYRPAAERWVSEGMKAVIQPEPEVGHFPRSGPYLLRLGKKKRKKEGKAEESFLTLPLVYAWQFK